MSNILKSSSHQVIDDLYNNLNDSISIFQNFSRNIPLYHYTTTSGLLGILSSDCLWSSNAYFLNDLSEYNYAFNIIKEQIEKSKLRFVDSFNTILDNAFKYIQLQIDYYVISFSECKDLLSQWRAYSNCGNGYSLGFNLHDLFNTFKPNLDCNYAFIQKVTYNTTEQKVIIDNVLNRAFVYFNNTPNIDENDFIFTLSLFLSGCMLWFKHDAFHEENEWRIIFIPNYDTDNQYMEFREGSDRLIPYFKLYRYLDNNRSKLPVSSIHYGPTTNFNLTDRALNLLLKRYKYNSVSIHGSSNPLCR